MGEGEVKEEWEKLKKRVKVAVERIEREREREGGRRRNERMVR